MPSTFTFRFFAAILLMGHLFSLSAWAQSGRPTIDDIDILCNDSFEMPPPPPPIILSGATCHVTFKNDDPILEGAGRSKELHYGALSDGPVTMTFSNRTAPWVVEVRDEEGGLLLRSSGDGKGEGKSISVDLSAGDAIRITVALADEGTRGKLRFILKETNIEEGNERLDEARRETGRFRSLFLEALEAGDRTAASDAMRKGIEAARSYRGYRWDHKLIGFLAWIRGYDLVKNDPVAWLKTTEPVVDYLEIKFNPGDKRLLAFRRELAEAFSLNGQRERCLEQAELAWRITELAFREERETIFKARCDYALALGDVGCHYDSYTIHERVLKEFGHILAGDALDEAQFRLNYSACMWAVGDLYGSRHEIEAALAILEQKVDSKNLNLLKVRLHHATVLYSMGELLSAKTAAEKALATAEEILGATHLLLQECRQTLAIILTETGDLARARPLQENALKEVLAHHAGNTFQVQRAQIHLAGILLDSGDLDGARELAEQAMAIAETVRRKNDQNAQNAMGLLARIFFSLGEYEAARGMWGNLCEIWRDKWLSKSRLQFYSLANMALCEHHLGDTKAARLKLEETFSEFDRRSALSESDVFWYRANLAQMLADSGDKRGAVENVRLAMDGFRKFMARQMRSGAVREIEEATVAFGYIPDLFLSLVGGTPAFERESFKAVELCRSAGRRVAHARRKIPADGSEKIAALQYAYSRANCRVSEAGGDDLVAAIGKREIAERALASAREGLRAAAGLGRDVSADEVIAALGEGCAGVTIVRYGRRIPGNRAGEISLEKGMPSYLAFIIKKPNTICRIDLGPAEPIDGAVKEWRDSLCHKPASAAEGASARRAARELIRLVWKPIVGAVGEAKRLVIAPDALLATIPLDALPSIVPSYGPVAMTDPATFLGMEIPIAGIAGDQQAALVGQAGFVRGDAKCTYGTGSFLLVNTGTKIVRSGGGLLTTVALGAPDGSRTFALEGAIFVTGSAVQWLRDGLGIITSASEVEQLARTVDDSAGVVFVPALTGLGAPDWDPYARGMIIGINRGTTAGHIARATLEGIAFEVADVVDLMVREADVSLGQLNVDGGAAANDLLCQIQADLLDIEILRPRELQSTGLGAAFLAGLGTGVWSSPQDIAMSREVDHRFTPQSLDAQLSRERWRDAVNRSRGWAEPTDDSGDTTGR